LIRKIKLLVFQGWTVPLALLALAAASFGLLIPRLGLYWDDWSQLLVSRLYGLSGYWPYFASDRPLSAWTHILLVPLLGVNPLHWQIFTLGLRWLTACAMVWAFCALWPNARRQVVFAAFLFLVYPAFTQQSDAVAYHQHWLQYLIFFISIGAMIQSVRWRSQPRRAGAYTALALVTLALHCSITEFFSGVELVRPLLLWFLVSPTESSPRRRLVKTLRLYWPYFALLLAYVLWRLVFLRFPGEDSHPALLLEQFRTEPFSALATLGQFAGVDMLYILVGSWANVFDLRLAEAQLPTILFSWLLALGVAVAIFVYLARLRDPDPEGEIGKDWTRQAVLVGALVTLLGPAPIWVTGNQLINPDFHADRFGLVAMTGAALLFTAGIEWIGKKQLQKAALLAVLIGLAAGFHLRTANEYRWMWVHQTRFYWQLAWRAPAIQPGTAIVAEEIFLPNQELFSTSSALNLLYPQTPRPERLPIWMYALKPRFSQGIPASGEVHFSTRLRSYLFKAAAPEESVLIEYDPLKSRCLWVLSEQDRSNPDLSDLVRQALVISNPDRFQPGPALEGYPPVEIIGKEPSHGWCYYFEKADLARQVGDWQQVAALGDEAQARGFEPDRPKSDEPREWLPFIEGYARTGNWPVARDLTRVIVDKFPRHRGMLCDLWTGLEKSSLPAEGQPAAEVTGELGCASLPVALQ